MQSSDGFFVVLLKFTPKQIGGSVHMINFHPNWGSKFSQNSPKRVAKYGNFHKYHSKRVAKYDIFHKCCPKRVAKYKKVKPNRSMFNIRILNWRVALRWQKVSEHWNGNVVILMKFASMAAPGILKMTISVAVSDEISSKWRHLCISERQHISTHPDSTPGGSLQNHVMLDSGTRFNYICCNFTENITSNGYNKLSKDLLSFHFYSTQLISESHQQTHVLDIRAPKVFHRSYQPSTINIWPNFVM